MKFSQWDEEDFDSNIFEMKKVPIFDNLSKIGKLIKKGSNLSTLHWD